MAILGGEPHIRKDLPKIIDIFSVPMTIYTNGLLLTEKNLIENANYFVSLEGMKEYNDYIRGRGNYEKAFKALEMLVKNRDKLKSVGVRMTYCSKNYNDIFKMLKICEEMNIHLMLHPLLGNGVLTIDPDQQLELFKTIASSKNGVILQPHFWQYCGYEDSTCPAGKYRLAVAPNGMVTPCQWDHYILGDIYTDDYETLVENGKEFDKNKRWGISEICEFCDRVVACRGSCSRCLDYAFCPLQKKVSAASMFSSSQIRSIRGKASSMTSTNVVTC